MNINKKHLLVLSIMAGISGCANLTDSPYYRIWHDRAYEIKASPAVLQQVAGESEIPEAEPAIPEAEVSEQQIDTPVAQTVAYTEAPIIDKQNRNAYSVEGDPFQSYTRAAQMEYSREEAPLRRDYSNMNGEL